MKKSSFKLNVIDVLIIVLLVVAIAVGVVLISNRSVTDLNGKAKLEDKLVPVKLSYQVLIKEIPSEIVNNITKGSEIFESAQLREIGTVSKIDHKNAIRYEFNEISGEYVKTEIPDKFDVTLTLLSKGERGKFAYFVDEYEINIGRTVTVRGCGFATNGVVTQISEVK